jgi:hypothetical protein
MAGWNGDSPNQQISSEYLIGGDRLRAIRHGKHTYRLRYACGPSSTAHGSRSRLAGERRACSNSEAWPAQFY